MDILKVLCNAFCKKYFSNCDDPECDQELEECKGKLDKCQQDYAELLEEYSSLEKQYQEDKTYYESRIQGLLQMLANALQVPQITLQETPVEINYTQIVSTIQQKLGNVVFDLADDRYWTFSQNQIESILKTINEQIKAKWTTEVFDCDDFALTMAGLTAYTLYKNGFKDQLAFGIAWSSVHAFNFYIDKNLEIWIWEPQEAKTIGKATDYKIPNGMYNIQELWLMG